jgi:hypothetical protein
MSCAAWRLEPKDESWILKQWIVTVFRQQADSPVRFRLLINGESRTDAKRMARDEVG